MRERPRFSVARAAGIAGLDMCGPHVEQLTRLRDVVGASGVGEEAVVADAMEAAGRHVIRKRRMNSSMASVITLARSRPLAR